MRTSSTARRAATIGRSGCAPVRAARGAARGQGRARARAVDGARRGGADRGNRGCGDRVRRGALCYPRPWAAGLVGRGAPGARGAAHTRRGRSRARVRRGLPSRPAGSRRSFGSSTRQMRPTRPGAGVASPETARAGWRPGRQALPAAAAAGGDDQQDGSRFAAGQDARPEGDPGLQRAGGGQRAPDPSRLRGDARVARLRPPRADGGCDRAGAGAGRRGLTRDGHRGRGLLAQAPDGEHHRPQHPGADPPDSGLRTSARPGWDGGLYAFMRRVLSTDRGKALYRKRHATIEPVFGQMKSVQPTLRPLLTPRKIGRPLGVAAVRRQPHRTLRAGGWSADDA